MAEDFQKCDTVDLTTISIPPSDALQFLLDKQKSFGSRFVNFGNLTDDEKVAWTKEFIACISNELEELRNQLPWKHWKDYSNFKVNVPELKYEVIDILHFFLSICLIWGMDGEEILKFYVSKNKQNFKRQEDGYKA